MRASWPGLLTLAADAHAGGLMIVFAVAVTAVGVCDVGLLSEGCALAVLVDAGTDAVGVGGVDFVVD